MIPATRVYGISSKSATVTDTIYKATETSFECLHVDYSAVLNVQTCQKSFKYDTNMWMINI